MNRLLSWVSRASVGHFVPRAKTQPAVDRGAGRLMIAPGPFESVSATPGAGVRPVSSNFAICAFFSVRHESGFDSRTCAGCDARASQRAIGVPGGDGRCRRSITTSGGLNSRGAMRNRSPLPRRAKSCSPAPAPFIQAAFGDPVGAPDQRSIYETEGHRFESCRARSPLTSPGPAYGGGCAIG